MPYKNYEEQKENSRKNYWLNRKKKLKQVSDYYFAHWEEKQKYRKRWTVINPEKVKIAKQRYLQSGKGKIAIKKANAKQYKKDIEEGKIQARSAVRHAITIGKIKRLPCEKCGNIKSHAHHYKGYSLINYLDVQWLCAKHHKLKHYG